MQSHGWRMTARRRDERKYETLARDAKCHMWGTHWSPQTLDTKNPRKRKGRKK